MKLTITYDRRGNIAALVASPDGSEQTCSVVLTGKAVAEIESDELTADLNSKQVFEQLSNLMKSYRVELSGGGPRLVRKLPKTTKQTSR